MLNKDKFNLSEKRKELFEIILKEKPTAGRVYRIIKDQDKEFIKKDWDLIVMYVEGEINLEELIKRRNKLVGENLR